MKTSKTAQPNARLRLALLGVAAATATLILGLAVYAIWPRSSVAAEPASAYTLALGGAQDDDAIDPVSGPAVELLLAWYPGADTFYALCAEPLVVAARYAHGPQFVRLDCDHDGRPDAWSLFSEVGVTQDDMARLPAEDDTAWRPLD